MLRPVESKLQKQTGRAFKTVSRDISSLSDQASFLSNNLNFLLDATLGLINSEQNGIIKIFSVAAVVFLPPTLIASIYGMNFKDMPELDWLFGYPFALGLMVASAVFTYVFFKRKGWL
jgi:magnesium transporter